MPYRPGSGSFGVTLKDSDGVALEGTTISADTVTTLPLQVPWAVKGGGIYVKVNVTTAGGIQPQFEVSFDYDAETPSWTAVTNDANTSTAASFSAVVGETSSRLEWFGFHIPAAWKSSSGNTTSTAQLGNVAWRVALLGTSNNQDLVLAKAFLIKSEEG